MASAENLDGHHGAGSFPADPMHQFEIARYVDINIRFDNRLMCSKETARETGTDWDS